METTITVWIGDEERQVPAKMVVCGRCHGSGEHVNPAVDGSGISPEVFQEDPDFAEAYFSGVYDVTCYRCKGLRVTPEIDVERCTPEEIEAYRDDMRAEAEFAAECEAERRMGA